MNTTLNTKHLDIGCGPVPRNPLGAQHLFGIDIDPRIESMGPNFKSANVVLNPLPFADNEFDSVSAFDVIEHIPRVAVDYQSNTTRMPFLELMQEIHRVLKPGGVFYALTPAYPSPAAFQDPTHVNIITDETHAYFCADFAYAANYGFKGCFEALEVRRVYPKYFFSAKRDFKILLKNWHKRVIKREASHLVWQLKAVK